MGSGRDRTTSTALVAGSMGRRLTSMVLEKTGAGPVPARPELVPMLPSFEATPSLIAPGGSPLIATEAWTWGAANPCADRGLPGQRAGTAPVREGPCAGSRPGVHPRRGAGRAGRSRPGAGATHRSTRAPVTSA